MKRIVLSILSLVFLLSASIAYAHPPSDIIITYDAATKTLTAEIKHSVSNPTQHYIKKVDIGLNGKEIAELKFKKQDSYFSQDITYTFTDIKPADTLSVEAYCSISGKLKKEIKAE
jgi:desulfoferrodoxin (superoxide reductase-like protein)